MRRWRVPLAGIAVGVLVIAVYFAVFHQPRRSEIAATRSETERLRSQRASLQREIDALDEVAARETEFGAALAVLERLIPSGLAHPTLLAQLQAAAGDAGVHLVSVTFDDPAVPEGAPPSPVPGTVLVAMPMTVVVEGDYFLVADMLRRLETDIARAVLVRTVALTEAEPGFPRLTTTWSAQAYALLAPNDPLLVDPEAPPPAPAPPEDQAPPSGQSAGASPSGGAR